VKNEVNDIIKQLIATSLAGEANTQQEAQLQAWISESQENARQFEAYKKIYALSDKHYTKNQYHDLKIDIDHEWNHFTQRIQNTAASNSRKLQNDRQPAWLKIAASLLILVASAFVINYLISKNENVRIETAGQTQTITLPDGSEVTINRYSSISYSQDFGAEARAVTLTGEAFFNITPNTEKPFTIQANRTSVEVVGTSFNVRAYDSLDETTVIVKTGVVKFYIPGLRKELRLTAGQKGVYGKNTERLICVTNDDPNFLAWNTKEIAFSDTDLKTVVETLNRAYNAHIIISADVPDNCVVTVKFDHQSLEAVLRVLETTLNLTYKIDSDKIEITSAGC
jgi:transmembrane sensor